jgi:uncharacterized protein YbjT (DUF2867 family)
MRQIFVTGGTGYLGSRFIPLMLNRGHKITALVRKGSESKVPEGCTIVVGDPLQAQTYQHRVKPADTFVHLVGVPHPSPAKAAQFRSIDLVAANASLDAARYANVNHFAYLSVAQPASVMKAYVESRREAEERIRESGINATFLRPWYVLGPGHRWAYALVPFYKLFEVFPLTRASALRLGLVTLPQMLNAMVRAAENPPNGIRIIDVPQIKNGFTQH